MQESEVISLITALLDRLGVQYEEVTFDTSTPHALYVVSTNESPILIGPQGAHLDALNHLVRRIVEQRFGEEQARLISVDVNGFKKRKIEDIQNKARMVAERVRLFKSNVELSPMSAYERMIIHALFANDPDIMTTSEGEGKFRRIILKSRSGGL